MRAADVAFVGALVHHYPVLLGIFSEHLKDMGGEILPHLFMGDVVRWVVAQLLRNGSDDPALNEVLNFLEQSFAEGSDEVQELLAVSFLENFPRPGEPGSELRSIIGPCMQNELRKLG